MNPAARALQARYTAAEIAERCVAAEAEAQRLRDVITNDGKYTWYHFETWANGIENRQRHPSILTEWLFTISRLVKSLQGGDDEAG